VLDDSLTVIVHTQVELQRRIGFVKSVYLIPIITVFSLALLPIHSAMSNVPSSEDIDQIYEKLDQAEILGGAYSSEMGELWLALGQALKRRTDYDEAASMVSRGMHVDKVNRGLISATQITYLKELSDIEYLRGDHKRSIEYSHNAYRLFLKTHSKNKRKLLEEIHALKQAHLDKFELMGDTSGKAYLEAAHFFAHTAAIIAQTYLNDAPSLQQDAYDSLASVSYLTALHLSPNGITRQIDSTPTPLIPSNPRSANQYEEPQNNWLTRSYRLGKDALLSNLATSEKSDKQSPLEKAKDAAKLADWYLVFGYPHKAAKVYKKAWGHLRQSEVVDTQQEHLDYFQIPRAINFADSGTSPEDKNLTLTVDITRFGRIKRAHFVASNEEMTEKMRNKAIRKVKALRFRPQLSEGRAVDSKNITQTFSVNL